MLTNRRSAVLAMLLRSGALVSGPANPKILVTGGADRTSEHTEADHKAISGNVAVRATFDDVRGDAILKFGYMKPDPTYQGDRGASHALSSSGTRKYQGTGTGASSVVTFPFVGLVDHQSRTQVSQMGESCSIQDGDSQPHAYYQDEA